MPVKVRTPLRSAEQIVGAAAASLGDASDLAAVLQGIAAAGCTALGADRATCYAFDGETGLVSAVYTTEEDPKRRAFLERTVGLGPDRLPIWRLQLAQSDPLMAVEDVARDPAMPAALASLLGSGAFLGVRLEHLSVRSEGSPVLLGTLFCSYARPRRFSAIERQAARGLAALAALALANARLQAETALSLAAASAASETIHRQRDFSAALVASMQDGLTVLSPEGRLVEVSPSFCRMTGFSSEELIGRGCPYPYWPDADAEGVERGLRRLRETGPAEWDLEFRRKDGERFPVILAGSLLPGHDGEVLGYLGTVKDITERKRAEQRLQRSAAQNQALAAEQAALRRVATTVAGEAPPEEVFALVAREVACLLGAAAGTVVSFGPEDGMVMGAWARETGGGVAVGTVVPLGGEGGCARVSRSGEPARMEDYDNLDEETRKLVGAPYRAGVAAPIRVGPRLWGAIGVLSNRHEPLEAGAEQRLASFAELVGVGIANAEARARLAAQAATDPLTGLANHRVFFERLHADVERARRHGRPLSLVIIDLDLFKLVNDSHGHPTGDRVLVEVAERLSTLTRAEDTLARIGGEEFAWLLPESDAHQGWAAAERARVAIAATPFTRAGRVTMSAGIASLAPGGSVNELVHAADAALYWAKAEGRDACVPYTAEHAQHPLPPGASARLALSVERLLAMVREQLGLTVAAVGEFTGGQEVWRYLAGDGHAFGLHIGEGRPLDETYGQRVVEGELPSLVRDVRREERTRDLPITAETGVGAYVGVPITLPGGQLYGVLCCLSPRPEPALGAGEVGLLRIVAGMLGEELDREQRDGQARHDQRENIARVLEGEGITIVLQPIVELATGRVVAAEALSRFGGEPGRPPDVWFAEAEAVGLGLELELAAIRIAMTHLDELPAGVRLTVNASPATLLSPSLATALSAAPGERMTVELTEHAPVADYAALEAALAGPRSRGVQFMIDDAGAGFSSLKHVLGLHPDAIKLDLALTRDIDSDPVRRALAASLVAFAREIGAMIVAEGIETREELETLRSLGITHGQGYYLAHPGAGPVPEHVALGDATAKATPAQAGP
jgi:diguanylate cyclase (GGDEF)-like protein/PAS domain S-box-containing protein